MSPICFPELVNQSVKREAGLQFEFKLWSSYKLDVFIFGSFAYSHTCHVSPHWNPFMFPLTSTYSAAPGTKKQEFAAV